MNTRSGIILLILSLFIPVQAYAEPTDWKQYHDQDYFHWDNYDNDVHLLGAYSISLTTGLVLTHYFHVNKWEAAIISAAATGLAGTCKEVFHDTYASKTDIQMWYAGGIAGGLSLIVLEF